MGNGDSADAALNRAVNGDVGGCASAADGVGGFEPTLLEGGGGECAITEATKCATGQGMTPTEA